MPQWQNCQAGARPTKPEMFDFGPLRERFAEPWSWQTDRKTELDRKMGFREAEGVPL